MPMGFALRYQRQTHLNLFFSFLIHLLPTKFFYDYASQTLPVNLLIFILNDKFGSYHWVLWPALVWYWVHLISNRILFYLNWLIHYVRVSNYKTIKLIYNIYWRKSFINFRKSSNSNSGYFYLKLKFLWH